MKFRHTFSVALLATASLLSGCSLLDIKIDSQTTPLTQQELNTRLQTREYAIQFFAQVEQAADHLESQYPSTDKVHQSYVLLWKINAEEGMQRAAYQLSPTASLIDTWVFSHQMEAFFAHGAGKDLFTPMTQGEHQGKTVTLVTATHLRQEADDMARSVLSNSNYQTSLAFVQQFAAQHPFHDLSFIRTPAYREWLKANDIDPSEAIVTLGTMPEAIGDVSDRLSLASDQTPKIMTWKAQLIALNSTVSAEEVSAALNSVQATSEAFQDFVANNPEYMRDLAEQMAKELQPLVADIDAKTTLQLAKLSEERQALDTMVARERAELVLLVERERKAIGEIVSEEREKLAQDLDQLSQDVITLAMDKIIDLVQSTLLYFVLFIVTIFFAPLGLGYFLGRRSAHPKTK